MNRKVLIISCLAIFCNACSEIEPKPFEPSPGHIDQELESVGEIPELVQTAPVVPEPEPPAELEKYTVVVNEVPVKELLFALARDAEINVDIDPRIEGVVTINAVDQTLPQILDRITRQVNLRYEFQDDNLIILTDAPFLRRYKIDYINMARDTTSTVTIATQIATTGGAFSEGGAAGGGGAGNNNSTTDVTNIAFNRFWENLVRNVAAIIGETVTTSGAGSGIPVTTSVIPNPETGFLSVRATRGQHEEVQTFIDSVLESAHRQVMIQATIVEVDLSDQYQAGIDWQFLNNLAGVSVVSATLPAALPAGVISSLVIDYVDTEIAGEDSLNLTVRLLEEFGNVSVLSSPQLMALNNQTAILKVVNNEVFFTIEQETNTTQGVVTQTFESTIHTVPVGIVMAVTPHINQADSIILNVRPTISRIGDEVQDPNPALRQIGAPPIANLIPEIQVREMESLLRLNNGQIAVLGGLMQNLSRDNLNSIPGASRLPGFLGKAFETTTKEYFKSELVIFLRPIIIRNPSIDGDLQLYRTFLKNRPKTIKESSGVNDL